MTAKSLADVIERQMLAESAYLAAVSSFPCILAERRRVLDEAEAELAAAVARVLAGRPADGAGFPDVSDPADRIVTDG